MSNVHDDRPTTSTEDSLAIVLAEVRKLGARIERLEQRFEGLDAPGTNRVPLVPSLALRSDGKVLLAVAHVEGANIADRERWEGIVLSEPEAAKLFGAMSDAADGARAHGASWGGPRTGCWRSLRARYLGYARSNLRAPKPSASIEPPFRVAKGYPLPLATRHLESIVRQQEVVWTLAVGRVQVKV